MLMSFRNSHFFRIYWATERRFPDGDFRRVWGSRFAWRLALMATVLL
jgi:hypothetical protein